MKPIARTMLCLLLALSQLFFLGGCGTNNNNPTQTEGETDVKSPELSSEYVIVLSENAPNTLRTAARKLKLAIENEFGFDVNVVTDTEKESAKEIIIGKTTREVPQSISTLAKDTFRIITSGEKIFIAGSNNETTTDGIYQLIANISVWFQEFENLDISGKINGSLVNEKNIVNFDIVYSENEGSTPEVCAKHIKNKIQALFGVEIDVCTLKQSKKDNHIVVGTVDTSESKKVGYSLSDREFAVQTSIANNGEINIYVDGVDDVALWRAAIYFYDACVTRSGFEIPAQLNVKIKALFARDPFILHANGKYYMYVNIEDRVWGAYTSTDMIHWSDHYITVCTPEGQPASFDGVKDFWAPEVHYYQGNYYMFVTYKRTGETRNYRVGGIFKSASPEGPFVYNCDGPIVPFDGMVADGQVVEDGFSWSVIDPTLYVDEHGQPWIVFSHEWVSLSDGGTFCAAKLSADLSRIEGEITTLFNTYDGFESTEAVTDAAYIYRTEGGQLLLLWSNYDHVGGKGYRVYIARSESGNILGPWTHDTEYLYEKSKNSIYTLYDGGHPSFVRDTTGQFCLVIHSPSLHMESVNIIPLEEVNNTLRIRQYR